MSENKHGGGQRSEAEKSKLDALQWPKNFKDAGKIIMNNPEKWKQAREEQAFCNLIRSAKPDEMQIIALIYESMHDYQSSDEWRKKQSDFNEQAHADGFYDEDKLHELETKDLLEKFYEIIGKLPADTWIKDLIQIDVPYRLRPRINYTIEQIDLLVEKKLDGYDYPLDSLANIKILPKDEQDEIKRKTMVSDAICGLFSTEVMNYAPSDRRTHLASYEDDITKGQPIDAKDLMAALSS